MTVYVGRVMECLHALTGLDKWDADPDLNVWYVDAGAPLRVGVAVHPTISEVSGHQQGAARGRPLERM